MAESPCALVAGMFGWTGNMERLALSNAHQKADDPQREFYLKQRKSLEINPRHPLIKDLLRRVKDDPEDQKAKDIAVMLFRTGNLILSMFCLNVSKIVVLPSIIINNKTAFFIYFGKNLLIYFYYLATLRSGFMLQESADFAESVEALMRQSLGIPLDEKVSYDDEESIGDQQAEEEEEENKEEHDEL